MYTNMEFGYRELSSHGGVLCGIVEKKKKDRIMVEKHFLEMSLLTKTDYSK